MMDTPTIAVLSLVVGLLALLFGPGLVVRGWNRLRTYLRRHHLDLQAVTLQQHGLLLAWAGTGLLALPNRDAIRNLSNPDFESELAAAGMEFRWEFANKTTSARTRGWSQAFLTDGTTWKAEPQAQGDRLVLMVRAKGVASEAEEREWKFVVVDGRRFAWDGPLDDLEEREKPLQLPLELDRAFQEPFEKAGVRLTWPRKPELGGGKLPADARPVFLTDLATWKQAVEFGRELMLVARPTGQRDKQEGRGRAETAVEAAIRRAQEDERRRQREAWLHTPEAVRAATEEFKAVIESWKSKVAAMNGAGGFECGPGRGPDEFAVRSSRASLVAGWHSRFVNDAKDAGLSITEFDGWLPGPGLFDMELVKVERGPTFRYAFELGDNDVRRWRDTNNQRNAFTSEQLAEHHLRRLVEHGHDG